MPRDGSLGTLLALDDRRPSRWLVGTLAVLVVVRLAALPSVLRERVVLSSNDPYLYRYWVERRLAAAGSPLDLGAFVDLGPAAVGEPLLVATLTWLTELLGGGSTAADWVLVWYPVVSAVLTGLLVYALATMLAEDSRVGLAAVGFLAVTPAHAFRTSLGFADHHAFDYLWLALTVLCLVLLLAREREPWSRWTWLLAGGLGVGVAGQTLAWEAGPLLLVPVGLCVAVFGLLVVADSEREARSFGPVLCGLVVAAVVTAGVHIGAGWQTTAVASAPALLLVGTIGVAGAATLVERAGQSVGTIAGVAAVVAGTGVLLVARTVPGIPTALGRGIGRLLGTPGVAEADSLLATFGPVIGPVVVLGFAPAFALPVAGWAVLRAVRDHWVGWLVITIYVGYFLGLTLLQRRFAGELAPLLAVPAGLGLIAFLAWLELIRPPAVLGDDTFGERSSPNEEPPVAMRSRRRLTVLGLFGAIFAGPGGLFSGVISRRLSVSDAQYGAAQWMREFAETRGWSYPESYVFSQWGHNRLYNYVVSGESRSYQYAQENYGAFAFSSRSEAWYRQLRDRTGFVVTEPVADTPAPFDLQHRLHEALASADGNAPGLAHYRAGYVSPDGSVKVFTLVPGATLTGCVDGAGGSLVVRTVVSPAGIEESRTYRRRVQPDEDGSFAVTVAHPGRYDVGRPGDGTVATVTVTESAVLRGRPVAVGR